MEKQFKYKIRKTHLGALSIACGIFFSGGYAQAEEEKTEPVVIENSEDLSARQKPSLEVTTLPTPEKNDVLISEKNNVSTSPVEAEEILENKIATPEVAASVINAVGVYPLELSEELMLENPSSPSEQDKQIIENEIRTLNQLPENSVIKFLENKVIISVPGYEDLEMLTYDFTGTESVPTNNEASNENTTTEDTSSDTVTDETPTHNIGEGITAEDAKLLLDSLEPINFIPLINYDLISAYGRNYDIGFYNNDGDDLPKLAKNPNGEVHVEYEKYLKEYDEALANGCGMDCPAWNGKPQPKELQLDTGHLEGYNLLVNPKPGLVYTLSNYDPKKSGEQSIIVVAEHIPTNQRREIPVTIKIRSPREVTGGIKLVNPDNILLQDSYHLEWIHRTDPKNSKYDEAKAAYRFVNSSSTSGLIYYYSESEDWRYRMISSFLYNSHKFDTKSETITTYYDVVWADGEHELLEVTDYFAFKKDSDSEEMKIKKTVHIDNYATFAVHYLKEDQSINHLNWRTVSNDKILKKELYWNSSEQLNEDSNFFNNVKATTGVIEPPKGIKDIDSYVRREQLVSGDNIIFDPKQTITDSTGKVWHYNPAKTYQLLEDNFWATMNGDGNVDNPVDGHSNNTTAKSELIEKLKQLNIDVPNEVIDAKIIGFYIDEHETTYIIREVGDVEKITYSDIASFQDGITNTNITIKKATYPVKYRGLLITSNITPTEINREVEDVYEKYKGYFGELNTHYDYIITDKLNRLKEFANTGILKIKFSDFAKSSILGGWGHSSSMHDKFSSAFSDMNRQQGLGNLQPWMEGLLAKAYFNIDVRYHMVENFTLPLVYSLAPTTETPPPPTIPPKEEIPFNDGEIPGTPPTYDLPELDISLSPNTYPKHEKPEIPLEFDKPNTYPTVDKPELEIGIVPNTSPKHEKPEIPLEFDKPNTYPTVDKPELEIGIVPNTSPKHEKPEIKLEFDKPNTYPTVDKPELEIGIVPNTSPKHEKPEITLEFDKPNTYPTVDKPELEIGIVPNTYPVHDKPELNIPSKPTPPGETPPPSGETPPPPGETPPPSGETPPPPGETPPPPGETPPPSGETPPPPGETPPPSGETPPPSGELPKTAATTRENNTSLPLGLLAALVAAGLITGRRSSKELN